MPGFSEFQANGSGGDQSAVNGALGGRAGGSLAEAAIALGLPVFPCRADKRPCTPRGFKDAVTDPAEIRRLFRMPGATLIGVPTGEASGLCVADLDCKAGAAGLEWLAANEHRLSPTRRHRTRSGGIHLLFQRPAGRRIRNSASRIAPGVDIRGEGGYVIFPPSAGYEVVELAMPADMPAWLIEATDPPPPPASPPPGPARRLTDGDGTPFGLAALDGECTAILNAADGQKHAVLNRAAYSIGGLVAAGELVEGPAIGALASALAGIKARCDDFKAAERTLAQAFRDGMAAPRSVPPPRQARHEPPPHNEIPDHHRGRTPEPEEDLRPEDYGEAPPPRPEPEPEPKQEEAPQKRKGEKQRKPPRIISARALMAMNLPPLRFVLNEILPVGYTILAGPPKLGKSWVAYQLALAVASGADLFGQGTSQGEVLYLALEDGERRMQSRMGKLLGDRPAPDALSLATHWARLDMGGTEDIRAWAAKCGDRARLCIIDTLQKIRPPSSQAGNAYEQDYALHGELHGLAHDLGIALVNITHMRKGSSGGDWVEGVIGSGGITGSADTIMALKRDRGAADAFLSVTGRDVRDEELALRSDGGPWTCLGAAEHVRMGETKKKLLEAVATAGERGISPREAADVAEVKHELAKKTLRRMAEAGEIMNLGGRYARRSL